jgi:hypothetical protein
MTELGKDNSKKDRSSSKSRSHSKFTVISNWRGTSVSNENAGRRVKGRKSKRRRQKRRSDV